MSRLQTLASKLYPYCIKVAEDRVESPIDSATPTTTPVKPSKPNLVQRQTSDLINKGVDTLKGQAKEQANDYLANNWKSILRNFATLSGLSDRSQELYQQVDDSETASAIREGVLPSVNRLIRSPSWSSLRNASRQYLEMSTPEERDTLFQSLQRMQEGDSFPMWPKSSPWMSSALPSYFYYSTPDTGYEVPATELIGNNSYIQDESVLPPTANIGGTKSYLPEDPMLATKKILQRVVNPTTFAWDIPYVYNKGVNAGLLPAYTFTDYLKSRNQSLADWLRTGSSFADYTRALADTGTYVIGKKGMEKAVKNNLDYVSTGIPKGFTANVYNSIPVATDLAGKGLYSLGGHGLGSVAKKILSWAGAKSVGGPASVAISLPIDVSNLSGVINNIEKQTSLNSYSNYDPKTNTYKAPFLIRNPGSSELTPSGHSIIMAPNTFGEHPYDLIKMLRWNEWGNNDANKYQRAYLNELRKRDPDNTRGIPYDSLENQPLLPVFTEQGNYVLAIPPRTRTWGEHLEDWGKWRRGEPITLREDQNWVVPVDNNGDPIPAKMPEDDRWFAGARDAMGKTWTSVYNALGGNKKNKIYDPALPLRLYGREIRRAHGKLSPHPVFTQLNEAWGTLQSRQKALENRQNQLKLRVARAGGDALVWATDSDLVREANQLLQDITEFKKDVMNLYEQEDRLQKEYDTSAKPAPPKATGSSYPEMALPQAFMSKKPIPSWQQRVY